MLHMKCLAQGLRMVVMVMQLPAAPATTLFTPSVPSPLVLGPLLWGIWPRSAFPSLSPGVNSGLCQLRCPDALPSTASPWIACCFRPQLRETPFSTPVLPNFTVGKQAQRGQNSPLETHSRMDS